MALVVHWLNSTPMRFAVVGVVASLFAVATAAAQSTPAGEVSPEVVRPEFTCPQFSVSPSKVNDYRLRDSSEWLRWSVDDNWKAHTGPAIERIRNGEYSHRVMADLNFTLVGWPNHIPALRALIDYTLAGGKPYEFPPAECYFEHARRFHPDDIEVIMLEGYFYWKQSNYARAKQAYLDALAINPTSAEAHYNLGLVLIAMKDYEAALAHARAAYDAGYPLPGLRNQLKQLGYWRESPGSESPAASGQGVYQTSGRQ